MPAKAGIHCTRSDSPVISVDSCLRRNDENIYLILLWQGLLASPHYHAKAKPTGGSPRPGTLPVLPTNFGGAEVRHRVRTRFSPIDLPALHSLT